MALNLAIDAVGAKHSGAMAVASAVVQAAVRLEGLGRVDLFCSPQASASFQKLGGERLRCFAVSQAELGVVRRIHWLMHGFSKAVKEVGADVGLTLSGCSIIHATIPRAVFIQQSLPFSREAIKRLGLNQRIKVAAIRHMMQVAAGSANLVIVQTHVMKEWVAKAFRIDPDKIWVSEPDVRLNASVSIHSPLLEQMRDAREGQRLLYVGNDWPYKNLEVLRIALPRIKQYFPAVQLFATAANDHWLAKTPGVVALPYIEGDALREAYDLATVVIMPSFVETIGLPMLEAMLTGTPVVAADRPYAREVCRDAALYFDPLRPEDLVEKVIRILGSEELKAQLGRRGYQLAKQRQQKDPYSELVMKIANMHSS